MTNDASGGPPARNRWLRLVVIILVMGGAIALAMWRMVPPAPVSGEVFDTAAALADLKVIARLPHPILMPENRRVREYAVGRLRGMGLDVRVQEGRHTNGRGESWPLANVVARVRGTAGVAGAVMLSAHYDSVAAGPGAGDDGAAVAALLQVAGMLAKEPCKRDMVFLFTDAEEAGLWGAKMFVQADPWWNEVAVDLNFEARGSSGPSTMFQTSGNNAWLVNQYAAVGPHPFTTSAAGEVYKRMPNDTDLTVFMRNGLPGLNFAFIGSFENYHQHTDDVAHLSVRSLRHHGVQAVAMARRLGNTRDLAEEMGRQRGDAVYFDVWSLGVVRYPVRAAVPLAAVAMAAVVALVVWVKRQASIFGAIAGVLLSLLSIGLSCVAMYYGVRLFMAHGGSEPTLQENFGWVFGGGVVLQCVVAVGLCAVVRRWVRPVSMLAGIAVLWACAGMAAAIWAPGASYLVLVPLCLVCGAGLVRGEGWMRFTITLALCAVAGSVFAGSMYAMGQGMAVHGVHIALALPGLVLWLVLPVLWMAGSNRGRKDERGDAEDAERSN